MNKLALNLLGALCFMGMVGAANPVAAEPPAIWGTKHIVTHMSLNATGFISWLKVVNRVDLPEAGASASEAACSDITHGSGCPVGEACSDNPAWTSPEDTVPRGLCKLDGGARYIKADIIWTLADGTEGSVEGADLGAADANGIATVSEASILAAMGNPTQLADVSLEVYIWNPDAIVTAEKKASDGRLPILVERVYLLTAPISE